MIVFAYTKCGLSIDEFFNLSFFEWSLEVLKVKERNDERLSDWEWDWARVRSLWLILANVNRDSKKVPQPFKPTDLIKLSFDKEETEVKRYTPEEVEKKFGKTLKEKIR